MRRILLAVLLLSATGPVARAEVKQSARAGFLVEHRLHVATTPARLFRSITGIGGWWSDAHTWSGSARNLSIDPRAGGCYCERWKDGSARHGEVTQVRKDRLLRLEATLGPLQKLAVTGILSFALEPAADGTDLTVSYRVSGDESHGLETIASGVDQVLGEQLGRLRKLAETGRPE